MVYHLDFLWLANTFLNSKANPIGGAHNIVVTSTSDIPSNIIHAGIIASTTNMANAIAFAILFVFAIIFASYRPSRCKQKRCLPPTGMLLLPNIPGW